MSQSEELLSKLPACPVETTLTLIGNKWEVLILRDLMAGTKRFGELKKSLAGISQKVPPRVEYSLTPLGKSLQPVLDALRDWGTEYKRHLSSGAPMVE